MEVNCSLIGTHLTTKAGITIGDWDAANSFVRQ